MNKVIIELHDDANFETALKTLTELPFVNDIKFIQTNDQLPNAASNALHPTELNRTVKGWTNSLENDDFWKSM